MSEQFDWNQALNGSMLNNPQMLQNQQAYDNIRNIENIGNQQRAQQSQMRNVANAAAFMSARDNGGMMSPDLRATLTETLGQPIFGGVDLPDGGFAYLGPSQSEQGKMGIVGRVDALTRLKILQDAQLGDRTIGQQKALWGMLSQKYTPEQMESAGIHDPNTAWSVGHAVQVGGSGNYTNSRNGNLSTDVMSDSGARPGPRSRFVSEDDVNGTPYYQPNGEGTRYRGHGVSTFSTNDWKEDREDKRRREQQGYDIAMAQAKVKQRNGSSGRSVEDQMAIDDNRAKNAKQAQEDKKDLALKKLYEQRVASDEKAIDEYAKSRKKGRKVGNVETKLTDEELAKAEEDIAAYRKRREEARAKDFEGFDFGKKGESDKGAGGAGSGEGSSTTHSAGGDGTTSVQQQGGGASGAGAGQVTGKKEDNGGGKTDGVTITKAQLKRAEAKGAHYDEKTGELVTKDGRRLKATIQ